MRASWIVAIALCLAPAACSNEPLDTAPNVDLARFQGQWFEIGKLPRLTQSKCTATTAFYILREGGLDVTNQCHLGSPDGQLKSSFARANGTDDFAKLAIDIEGFSGDYWILEVGEHYEYAVVGVPSREYLWIMSRTSKMEKPVLDGIIERMKAKKFDMTKLELTQQAN